MKYDLIVVGGGAAGFFCAIQSAEQNPNLKILILEKSKEVLSKVRVSGGGRCNVTHACFDPVEMAGYYPRGNKELLGPFHTFLCGDMMGWLSDHGVDTKIEDDGRVFPLSNSSETIIHCFLDLCQKYHINITTQTGVENVKRNADYWVIKTTKGEFQSSNLMIASGSSPSAWKMIKQLGHLIVEPVPSLFTFNIKNQLLEGLAGISLPNAEVTIKDSKLNQSGPLLITHWGLSGPAILKLSAWAARELFDQKYQFEILVNWIGLEEDVVLDALQSCKKNHGKKLVINAPQFGLPKRLWQKIITLLDLETTNFADLNAQQINALINYLIRCLLTVSGKSTFKEEFVTCGGIDTKEINFKTMESRLLPGLYFAGEVINIDAVTGGFNFQAAWTEAFIAAKAITQNTR